MWRQLFLLPTNDHCRFVLTVTTSVPESSPNSWCVVALQHKICLNVSLLISMYLVLFLLVSILMDRWGSHVESDRTCCGCIHPEPLSPSYSGRVEIQYAAFGSSRTLTICFAILVFFFSESFHWPNANVSQKSLDFHEDLGACNVFSFHQKIPYHWHGAAIPGLTHLGKSTWQGFTELKLKNVLKNTLEMWHFLKGRTTSPFLSLSSEKKW